MRALATLALSLPLLAACSSLGIESDLGFQDLSLGAPTLGERALATGADMQIRVVCGRCDTADVTEATSEAPSVLEVVGFADDVVTVRGLAPGTAFLRVHIGGTDDAIAIHVEDAEDATIRMLPWPDFAPLPASLWDGGFAMLSGSEIEIRAFPKDAAGERLTGFGGVSWAVDDTSAADLSRVSGLGADQVQVVATGAAGSSFVVTPTVGDQKPIRIVGEADVDHLEVYVGRATDFLLHEGDELELEAGAATIFHVVALTADGLYVSGPGATLATFTVGGDLAGTVTDAVATLTTDGGDDPRLEYDRGFLLTGSQSGTAGPLTFDWAGHSVTIALRIVPAS
ncbi:MAG: hypothetical protein H6700_02700 [Myxococcales bacterium]|nr:hypothetical protein [Myxococcales bacterium]MCB9519627.1 hypothetical protein [Myxococcales bacterium]MCB9530649.1 hypothetical protein [Myxococcales bacterium]